MTRILRSNACRWLAAAALTAFCLKQSVSSAREYLGSSDAYAYFADWCAAARRMPDGKAALLCGDAKRISPVERSRLISISWEHMPNPLQVIDETSDLRLLNCVLSSRWISSSSAAKLKADRFSVAFSGEHVKVWVRDGIDLHVSQRRAEDVSVLRELIASFAVLTLMLFGFTWAFGVRGYDKCAVIAAVLVATVLGIIALAHPLLAPNGLGTYGGRAKLLFTCGGIPEGFLKSAGGEVLQPSYPPGLTLLAYLHFLLSGGCGDRLVQLVVVFAMSLLCFGLARKGASPWAALPAALYCLSPAAIRMTSGFYAEPLVALSLLLGWDMIGRGRPLLGALVMGVAGLFRPEAGIVASVFVMGISLSSCGFKKSLIAVALSVAPSIVWFAICHALGYGLLPDWDFGAMPKLWQVAYAAKSELKALAQYVLPAVAVAWLVKSCRRPTGNRVFSIASAVLLLLMIPLACAFYASRYGNWMIDNTIFRLVWYVSAVPLAGLFCSRQTAMGYGKIPST